MEMPFSSYAAQEMKLIPPQSGTAFRLLKGDRLEIVDPEGQQVSDLFCFNADDVDESFSAGRSIDYAESIYLSAGSLLYSNRSRPMFKIEKDSCGRHDALMTPCSLEMFRIVANDPSLVHAACLENLAQGFSEFGLSSDRIGTTFNLFMNVVVGSKGQLEILEPLSKAGDGVILEAMMDLIVGLTACSHEGSNAGLCKPIQYRVTRSI
jgi:uncharacterized protein YcgI (DUF1989 family)